VKVTSSDLVPVASVLELAERSIVEGILRNAVGVSDRSNLFQSPFGPLALGDGNCSIQRDHR